MVLLWSRTIGGLVGTNLWSIDAIERWLTFVDIVAVHELKFADLIDILQLGDFLFQGSHLFKNFFDTRIGHLSGTIDSKTIRKDIGEFLELFMLR